MQENETKQQKGSTQQAMSQLPVYMQETIHGLALEEGYAEAVTKFAENYVQQEQQSPKGKVEK